jgi:hypothetical protein
LATYAAFYSYLIRKGFVMVQRLIINLTASLVLLSSACSSFGSPTPAPDSQGTYSLETRTGLEEIDHVLAVVASGDRAQLESMIEYTTAPCTKQDGLGGPPKCREGEVEGTLFDVLPSISSEGSFIRKEEIAAWTGVNAEALFAVYRVSEDGAEEEYYPRGEYAIVFLSNENGTVVTLRILEGEIVRVDYSFYESMQDLQSWVEQDASEVILMPKVR